MKAPPFRQGSTQRSPAITELGSSTAAELTVSLAPMTSTRSKDSISGFTCWVGEVAAGHGQLLALADY